jgi:hypothetical protein
MDPLSDLRGGFLISFGEHPFPERRPSVHERHEVRSIDGPPARLGRLDQLESRGEAGGSRAGAFVTLVLARTGEKVDSIGLVLTAGS